jgi:methyltransferase (TIGR00027 family)
MAEPERVVRHVSDTARWAAIHRAKETERADAQFRDPFAHRLAGERGEQIAAAIAISEADSWSWMARTYLFDRFIGEQVREGCDLVVNLGAGLDTRPYRMAWPESLSWIEVDLPEILDYKEQILGGEKPTCRLERIRLDLANDTARRAFFQVLPGRAGKVLVLTEGVMIYLTAEAAGTLAGDLAAIPVIRDWVLDIASPGLLRMMQERARGQFSEKATPLQFAPGNGPEFFHAHGWRTADVQSLLKTAGRLNRLPEALRPFAHLPEDPARMGEQPWGGVCLLERAGSQ